jgi:ribosomal protein S18 acetylase RimI-like enzyme
MNIPVSVNLEEVHSIDIAEFQQVVAAYWQELMPHAPVIQDADRQIAYFKECFTWSGGNHHPHWALGAGRRVGFVSFAIDLDRHTASIDDFYVLPAERRHGFGSAMVQALYGHFDQLGIELIELNVRRDNPNALAFWEAQGFRVALYRLRQYRDPKTGTAFVGALSSDFAEQVS